MMSEPRPAALIDRSLGDLVTEHVPRAAVFERFGLDYCCHGHQTLKEAARDRGVAAETVLAELEALPVEPVPASEDVAAMDLDRLTKHIVERHHHYVRESVPVITAWLEKLVARHGPRHPELARVREAFAALADELLSHMHKEENILFPYIDAMARAQRAGKPAPRGPFGTVLHPVRVMEAEHAAAGDILDTVQSLTNAYTPPADGCGTFRLCYAELGRFAADLHQHIHLENHVLFTRAQDLEQALWG